MIDIALTIAGLTGIGGIVKYNLDSAKHFDRRLDTRAIAALIDRPADATYPLTSLFE